MIIAVSPRKNFCVEGLNVEEILHCIQLSFIQLGGGIAVGVNAEQKKFYTLLNTPEMLVLEGVSTGVRYFFSFFFGEGFHLPNYITSQIWNVGSVLCDIIIAVCMTYYVGFGHLSFLSSENIKFHAFYGSFHDMIPPSRKRK